MRRVYLSFLGRGSHDKEKGIYYYLPTVYELGGATSSKTRFVQAAELELLGADAFDVVLIAATRLSKETQYEALRRELEALGASPETVDLDEDMSAQGQWEWFEALLQVIEPGDELTVDMTHGYRSVPIVFSAALDFLQRARNVTLRAVYYGAFDKDRELSPIVDMRDFYVINEWADAVSRLVEEADARKLAEVAASAPDFQAGALGDDELIDALRGLTETIRNVDVNNVAVQANEALGRIVRRREQATATDRILLDLVVDKFTSLSTGEPVSGRYDQAYFEVQLELAGLLLEHRLFMQAYTVMREYIASLAMIPMERGGLKVKKRKSRRSQHAEVFFKFLQFDEDEWRFSEGQERMRPRVEPFYRDLKELGLEPKLRAFVSKLAEYRNGFDHAWISKGKAYSDIEQFGAECLTELRAVTKALVEHDLLD